MCEGKLTQEQLKKLFAEFESKTGLGGECDDCEYLHTWSEGRGEFWGAPCSEEMAECMMDDNVLECPKFIKWLKEKKKLCADCGRERHDGECKD